MRVMKLSPKARFISRVYCNMEWNFSISKRTLASTGEKSGRWEATILGAAHFIIPYIQFPLN
jgi:hypothetical protein